MTTHSTSSDNSLLRIPPFPPLHLSLILIVLLQINFQRLSQRIERNAIRLQELKPLGRSRTQSVDTEHLNSMARRGNMQPPVLEGQS